MGGFTADDQALHAAGFQLSVVVDDLEADFAVVRAQLDRLLDGGWSGAASRSLAGGWHEWVRGFTDSVSGLREMSRLLDATADSYAESEASSVADLGVVAGSLA